MSGKRRFGFGACLLGLIMLTAGCVIAPHDGYRDGYYDRDHHRYWHDHGWHDCADRGDQYCR